MINPITVLVENIMIPFLKAAYGIIPNYGVAIIILTMVIKIIFYPLTRKQFESMKAQKQMQPEMKAIQEKYKGQPEKLQSEMMKLWKKHGSNPFSGCLPTLIQIPFFIAVFYTIKSDLFLSLINTEINPGVNPGLFPFWISNLGVKDVTYILPVLVGLSTFLSQKLMMTDPKQAKMFMFMPVIMFFICLKMPSGVLLYWAVSQLISTAQQYYIMQKAGK
ncbi:MAG: membrane protein insertase YidC [bacterium]|nr:membrane protein insertase YidC [bacterium]